MIMIKFSVCKVRVFHHHVKSPEYGILHTKKVVFGLQMLLLVCYLSVFDGKGIEPWLIVKQ